MTLRDMIEADATAVFLNTGEFAESVTYKPRIKPTGDTRDETRSISAVVFREQMTTIDEDGGETTRRCSWFTLPTIPQTE